MHYAVRGVSPKITLLKFLPRNGGWRLVQKSIDLDLKPIGDLNGQDGAI
jgi:hypothetical protein